MQRKRTTCPSHSSCTGVELRDGSEATTASEASLASKKSATRFSRSPPPPPPAWISAMSLHGEVLQSLATGMLQLGGGGAEAAAEDGEKLATACEANEAEWIE